MVKALANQFCGPGSIPPESQHFSKCIYIAPFIAPNTSVSLVAVKLDNGFRLCVMLCVI